MDVDGKLLAQPKLTTVWMKINDEWCTTQILVQRIKSTHVQLVQIKRNSTERIILQSSTLTASALIWTELSRQYPSGDVAYEEVEEEVDIEEETEVVNIPGRSTCPGTCHFLLFTERTLCVFFCRRMVAQGRRYQD